MRARKRRTTQRSQGMEGCHSKSGPRNLSFEQGPSDEYAPDRA